MHAIAQTESNRQQQLVIRHYSMVRAMACRIHQRLPKQVELDDLISAGVLGLMAAIDRFDNTRSVPFDSYARHRVRGAIVDTLRAMDWVPRSVRRKSDSIKRVKEAFRLRHGYDPDRKQIAAALELTQERFNSLECDAQIRSLHSLDQSVSDDNQTPLVEQIDSGVDIANSHAADETRTQVLHAIRYLPERERTAVSMYYLHELSLKEIGKVLGVTESRACQLRSQGIKRLRFRLRKTAA
ncbi:MAG: FliA/WhiG family RNA polymerase sigma factor [Rhodobacterales bacterium]|nr:FliA/WhiG family RNA polymerase sigma factor [Rhodobacterales bacterium]